MDSTTSTTTTTSSSRSSSEVFICFNSRLSTKISAKPSILSPARDPHISLSNCHSRRLRTSSRNGGRSSPMFAAAGKKRGSGFDNPEPSSPKVTCIGQVRVKSKKKGIKVRAMPRRQSGEISFRTLDQIQRQSSYNSQFHIQQHRNQRWVHLPLSICESFNCLIPCKPCENGRVEKKQENQVVVMVGKRDEYDDDNEKLKEEEEMEMPIRSTRRHVFDKIDEIFQVKYDNDENNVPVPPKNALLLMRCRYDPLQMEALANRCSEPQSPEQFQDEDEEEKSERNKQVSMSLEKVKAQNAVQVAETEEFKVFQTESLFVSVDVINEQEDEVAAPTNEDEKTKTQDLGRNGELEYKEQENQEEEESEMNIVDLLQVLVDEESEEDDEIDLKNEDESRVSYSNASFSLQSDDDITETEEEEEDKEEESPALELETLNSSTEKMNQIKTLDEEDCKKKTEEVNKVEAIIERENVVERESSRLPNCLLLMMCEPKLSMEVSRETWVCNTDFIYQSPEKKKPPPNKPPDAGNEALTFPATATMASMAAMIEQKLLNATAYEPFVLTRCKSAPIRTAAIKLASDGWLWKNGGFEPHRRGNYGIGAAGVVGLSR